LALALQLDQPVLQESLSRCERQVVLLEQLEQRQLEQRQLALEQLALVHLVVLQLVQRQLVLVLQELVALNSERKYLGVLQALVLAAFRPLAYLLPADYFGSM
jgi:hypothetical protein